MASESLYALRTKTLEGKDVDLKEYEGKVALVVNVASECGNTPQYAGLEKLYQEFRGRDFVVLGFPSNDFGKQEPGSAKEIREFCSTKYRVTFPLFEKVVTRAGQEQSPIYGNLGGQAGGKLPEWNFAKYLVDKSGKVIKRYKASLPPEDAALRRDIEAAL